MELVGEAEVSEAEAAVVLVALAVLEAAVPEKDPDVPIVPMLVDVTIPAVADDADELDAPAMTEDHGTEVAGVGEPMDGPPLVLSLRPEVTVATTALGLLAREPTAVETELGTETLGDRSA